MKRFAPLDMARTLSYFILHTSYFLDFFSCSPVDFFYYFFPMTLYRYLTPRFGLITHIFASLLPLAWHYASTNQIPSYWTIILCLFFGLLPDIDTTTSFIGKLLYPLAKLIESQYGHRTVTHSLFAWAIISALVFELYHVDWVWLSAAYGSHLILDMIVGRGIPLFWPAQKILYFVQVKAQSTADDHIKNKV